MVGPINKTLDLVVTRIPPDRRSTRRTRFDDLASRYGVVLDEADQAALRDRATRAHEGAPSARRPRVR